VRIEGIIWLDSIVEKIERRHRLTASEVEEVLSGKPRFRDVEKGARKGENVYSAIGRTHAGRSLIVFFVHKARTHDALIISARAPSRRERKL